MWALRSNHGLDVMQFFHLAVFDHPLCAVDLDSPEGKRGGGDGRGGWGTGITVNFCLQRVRTSCLIPA